MGSQDVALGYAVAFFATVLVALPNLLFCKALGLFSGFGHLLPFPLCLLGPERPLLSNSAGCCDRLCRGDGAALTASRWRGCGGVLTTPEAR